MVDDGGWVCVALYIRIKALSLHKKLSSVVIIMIVTSWAMGTSSNDAYLHNHLQWCWCFYCSLRWTSESPSGGNLLLPFTWLDNTHTLCAPNATHKCTHIWVCTAPFFYGSVQMPELCIKRIYYTTMFLAHFRLPYSSFCAVGRGSSVSISVIQQALYPSKNNSIVKRLLVQLESKTDCRFDLFQAPVGERR